jgi:hypothetical protein
VDTLVLHASQYSGWAPLSSLPSSSPLPCPIGRAPLRARGLSG